jgi:UDP-N-acetyl-D-mannosaminuronic acid transferase (WecB/TagA/CpsF family)
MIKGGNPNLDIVRIKEIKERTSVPLVLHGGSGINDDDFRGLLTKTDLNVVDGVGLVWAHELNKIPISNFQFPKKIIYGLKVGGEILNGKHREGLVSGADLMPELCKLALKKGYKVFFLGGFGDRAERTVEYFRSQMSDLRCQFS